MTRLQILRDQRAQTLTTMDGINATIAKDNRAMTAEERAAFLTAQTEHDTAVDEITLLEGLERRRQATSTQPTPVVASPKETRVEVKDLSLEDPKKGFKDHRDFMTSVMQAGMGRREDPRLTPLRATQGSDEQGVYSDPHGGYLVPHGVAPGILSIQPEDDVLAGRVRDVPMRAPTVSYNARTDKNHTSSVSGGLTVTRRPETVDGTTSRMQFEQVTLTANERFGIAYATERILTDSPESFVAILAAGFSDEYAAVTMDERLNGTGAGEPLGILHANNGCLVSQAKETGQTADTIVKENIDKMSSRIWRPNTAVWLANHDTRPQLKSLSQTVGTGGSVVPYLTGSEGREFLDAKPIFFTEFAAKLGDAGDLILGNWSEYLWGAYMPLKSDESIHVRFVAAERCFRFYDRNDGSPWWRSALTPKRSAVTLSPFVILAAR